MIMSHRELVEAFSSTLGIEKSEEVIQEALNILSIPKKENYSKEEAIKICEQFGKNKLSVVRIVSHALKGRIRIR